MAWTRDFRASTVVLDINSAAAVPIRGIIQSSGQTNAEVESEQAAASIFADTITIKRVRPTFSFTTVDLPSAITNFGLLGKCIAGGAGDEGIVFYGQKQDCAGVGSGAVHDKYAIKNGIVVPNTLNVDHMGNASLSYDVYARYDGTTAPVVYTPSQSLPATSQGPVGRWTMYSLNAASVTVTGKRSVSIRFGAVVTQEGADSEIYDSVTSLQTIMPVLSVRGVDTSWFDNVVPLLGKYGTHGNTVLKLKRRDADVAATQHISISLNGMLTLEQMFSGGVGSPLECGFQMICSHDGTNSPILVSTGVGLSS